jgi:hypothetical protein
MSWGLGIRVMQFSVTGFTETEGNRMDNEASVSKG